MDRTSIRWMSVALAVSLGLSLLPAWGDAAGQGDEPVPPETLQVNYDSGQGYGNLPLYRPNEIIIQFEPNVLPTERHQIVQDHGCWIARTSDLGDFHLVCVPAGTSPEDMAAFFGQHERIRYAELNYCVQAAFVPDDKLYSYQWNFENTVTGGMRMNEAWSIEEGDPNVIVAVVDTGVAYESYGGYTQAPDLAETRFVPGYNFVADNNHPNDDNGHGTHVTGTIAQSTDNGIGVAGIAFRCSIMPVKVMDSDGLSDAFTVSQGILQQTFDSNPNVFAYWFFQGTSMAAPHVTGLAALLASHGVTSPDKIRKVMETTARDLGPKGWDAEYGWGMIDAHAALAVSSAATP